MAVVDLPPGIGLVGTPLGSFEAPKTARRLATASLLIVIFCGALTWVFVAKHWWRWHASTQFVLPIAFFAFSALGFAVRRAKVAVTRDGVRWGWTSLSFTQEAARITTCHVYRDGVALEAKRGSWWFLGARDWDRFDVLVRQLKRAELPVVEHEGKAPFRARLQSYGRFLDGLLVGSMVSAFIVMLWAA
ncbi:MAG TPA: hypothetical protein VMZ53_26395 [Kofleriaceae bacterium]|nr:hypothetical protein [Kofleriaceae bacterium]